MNSKIFAIAVVAVLVIAGVGIYMVVNDGDDGPQRDGNGKVVNMPCEEYTFTDASGATYTFDHTFGALCTDGTTYGSAFFAIAALTGDDVCDYLLGIDKDDAKVCFPWIFEEMPELDDLQEIGYGSDMNIATIMSLEPSCFITSLTEQDIIEASGGLKEQLDKAGIPLFYINYHAQDPAQTASDIRMIGALLGLSDKADEIADYYYSKTAPLYENAERLVAGNGGVRPVVYAENRGMPLSSISNTWGNYQQWGAIIYGVGGANVYTGTGTATLTLAEILSCDADKILITCRPSSATDVVSVGYGITEQDIMDRVEVLFGPDGRTGYSTLEAWEEGEVYVLSQRLGRQVFDFATVEFIAKMIWPEEYADLDPVGDLVWFWETYMPWSFSGTWMLDYGEAAGVR